MKRLKLWFKQTLCKHYWVAAIQGKDGAMVCPDCWKSIVISDAEFYARFGAKVNHVLAVRSRMNTGD